MENENLEDNLKAGIKEIQKISMNAQDKERILKSILSSDVKPVASPYSFSFIVSKIGHRHFAAYVMIPCLLLLLGGGAVGASAGTLPGDIFYSLKTKVVEPMRSALSFSQESKIDYEISLATERLIEAETLSNQKRLDPKKEEELNILLEAHTKKLDKTINEKKAMDDLDKEADQNEDLSKKSEQKNKKVKFEKAYEKLSGSETSSKEAKTLLKTSSRLLEVLNK
jgi:hypothetical protein